MFNSTFIPTPISSNTINNRAKLDTGTNCNYSCSFCYYYDKLDKVTSFEVIKTRIDYIKSCNITEIDLSGGESSIHKDWFKILDYCSAQDLKISCLSNGYKFSDISFLKKSQQHGLREILFSLHGSNSEIHDQMVGRSGAFNKIIKAIKNCHKLGIIIRINCAVTKNNYKVLSTNYVDLILRLNPSQLNFLTLNYWSDAKKLENFSYEQSTPEIKKAIDIIKNKMEINVRYTPFCFMEGYERYVVGIYQHIYDLKDWNIAVYNQNLIPDEYNQNKVKLLYQHAYNNRCATYNKFVECLKCSYRVICDGVEVKTKLSPVSGEVIKDVNHFRHKEGIE